MKNKLTEKQTLIQNIEKRIKGKKQRLAKAKAAHREVEAGIIKQIRMDEMQLSALKKS